MNPLRIRRFSYGDIFEGRPGVWMVGCGLFCDQAKLYSGRFAQNIDDVCHQLRQYQLLNRGARLSRGIHGPVVEFSSRGEGMKFIDRANAFMYS